MTSSVRFAVLGCGRIGRMHADMLARRVDGASLSVVFDVVDDAAQQVADQVGCRVAPSLADAVSSDDVDAVAICTSTDTHVDAMIAAAEAGVAIFCEKPISLNLVEVGRGLAAVESAGVKLQIGFNRRYDSGHRAVADAVRHGVVGDVHLLRITSRDPGVPPMDYIRVAGGLFNDMAIHDFDMARHVVGSEVVEVFARGAVLIDPAVGEAGDIDTAVSVLTHANGAITTIDNSRSATYGYDQRVEVFGSNGMAQSDNVHEFNARISTAEGERRPRLQDFFLERYEQSYLDQWATFVEYVNADDDAVSPLSGLDGRAPVVIAAAAARSHRENRPVTIAEIEEENA